MRKTLVFSLLFLILLPLVVISWFSLNRMKESGRIVEEQYRESVHRELQSHAVVISGNIKNIENELLTQLTAAGTDISKLQNLPETSPLIRATFYRNSAGELTYPNNSRSLSEQERLFLNRTKQLWEQEQFHVQLHAEQENTRDSYPSKIKRQKKVSQPVQANWLPWYWEEGVHLILWFKNRDGSVIGAEVERVYLLSSIIAKLPEKSDEKGLFVLKNGKNELIYRWGELPKGAAKEALKEINLTAPLDSWRLSYFSAIPLRDITRVEKQNVIILLITVTLLILFIGFYFYRETSRDLHEATHRVNFVNQVSHELKTPLTNIRLYAELLKEGFDDDDEEDHPTELSIILSESQRLSRMISNILTFSKREKTGITLHPRESDLNAVIEELMEQFSISLKRRGFTDIELDLQCRGALSIDADIVSQIIANCISNAEKYGHSGHYLRIKTHCSNGDVHIHVTDHGPGIPTNRLKKIFSPYVRLSDKATEGVSGTGIGLTLSRELARLHGGDLTVQSSPEETTFHCLIKEMRREI